MNSLDFLNNKNNTKYFSNVPLICTTFDCILGVDEAGRGFFLFNY